MSTPVDPTSKPEVRIEIEEAAETIDDLIRRLDRMVTLKEETDATVREQVTAKLN